ncbi:MAG: AraC family transcriptional regulator [Phycisphaeraceae bacterium]
MIWRTLSRIMGATAVQLPVRDSLLSFVLLHLRVRTNICTYQRLENGYTLPPRIVQDWNFIHVPRGRAMWVIDGQEHPLERGRLAVVPPHVLHRGYSLSKKLTLLSIHVEPTLPGGQDVFALLTPPRSLPVASRSRLERYLRGARVEWERLGAEPAVCRSYQAGWARLIVLELLLRQSPDEHRDSAAVDPLLRRVLEILQERVAQDLDLAELARLVGYSPQHLNRLFRKALGVTPLQHHRRLKLERAAHLLAHGGLTIRAAGAAVGFPDAFYFSRVFHKEMGLSPSDYRRSTESATSSPE